MGKTSFNLERVKGGATPAVVETEFTVDNRIALTDLSFEISAVFEYSGGSNTVTGISTIKAPLTLETYCYLIAPVKEADFKATLESSAEIPPLPDLFEDFISATKPDPQYYANPLVLSFLLNEGSICTLILSKAGSRNSLT